MTTIDTIQSLTDAQLLAVKKETVRRIVRETGLLRNIFRSRSSPPIETTYYKQLDI